MAEKMKPCPFCKDQDLLDVCQDATFQSGTFTAYGHCDNCGAQGPIAYSQNSPDVVIDMAVRDWNDRL